jgi:hypothetical protein
MEPSFDPAEPAATADAPAAAAAAGAAAGAAADIALATQVAAWHNRHPLAVRVRPEQVLGMGIVALPVVAGGGAGRRAAAAFSEHLMAPVTPRQAAVFALRHGVKERPDITPLREVPAVGANGAAVQWMYLRTVAIEAAGQRVRVLVAAGSDGRLRPAVLGARLWSLRRTLVAAALGGAVATVLLAGGVTGLWLLHAAPDGPMLAVVAPTASSPAADAPAASASAASGASAASEGSAASAVAVAVVPLESASAPASPSAPAADSPASAPWVAGVASAPGGEPAASAPVVAGPVAAPSTAGLARAAPPSMAASAAAVPASAAAVALADAARTADDAAAPADIRPRLTDEQRAEARRIGRQLRGEGEPTTAAAVPASSATAAPAAAAAGRHDAQATRITRGRAASQVMQSLMASAAAGAALPGQPRTEVMQVKEGFRAIWWPFASPADAEVARAALTAYGINAEVVEF